MATQNALQVLAGRFHLPMMRRVHQTICVRYDQIARDCIRELRVLPPQQRGIQQLIACDWNCEPTPDNVRDWIDERGNRMLQLQHRALKTLRFECQFDVENLAESSALAINNLGAWRLPSALCERTPEICNLATASTCSALESVQQLNQLAHQSLRYETGATDADTTASQALKLGAGVCQDYAHLLIALCRAAGFAARYVAGYGAQEGQMHAWVEVLIEDKWRGFDPTHGREIGALNVAVAHGRDYRDVLPHSGRFRGTARAHLQSHCTLQVLAAHST